MHIYISICMHGFKSIALIWIYKILIFIKRTYLNILWWLFCRCFSNRFICCMCWSIFSIFICRNWLCCLCVYEAVAFVRFDSVLWVNFWMYMGLVIIITNDIKYKCLFHSLWCLSVSKLLFKLISIEIIMI